MIPDRIFLRRCAQKNNLELPRELEDWLLVHFEDEPYENFNTASILEDMVCMYCQSFAYGRLDVTIPDPITRLKERYDDLKDLITVYCIINFPKVAEAIPQSCRGNCPNNAAVFGASLSLFGR